MSVCRNAGPRAVTNHARLGPCPAAIAPSTRTQVRNVSVAGEGVQGQVVVDGEDSGEV